MADRIAWLSLGLSALVAVVQFSGNRPVIDLEPDARHHDLNDFVFVARVRNATPTAVQLRRQWLPFSRASKLMAPGGVQAVAMQMFTGRLNLWLDAGASADLQLRHASGKWLVLVLFWRRASGLHLTSLLPLFVVYRPAALEALKMAQTKLSPLRI